MTTVTQNITSIAPAANPSSMTREVFSSTAAANVISIVAMTPELNTWAGQVNTVAGEVNANAATATTKASDAAASAAAAAASAGIIAWVSGTTYVIGDARWSPINFQSYRRITNGAGTTDPSLDITNWTAIGIVEPTGAYQITYLLYGGL